MDGNMQAWQDLTAADYNIHDLSHLWVDYST